MSIAFLSPIETKGTLILLDTYRKDTLNIANWLNPIPRADSSFSFKVTDLEETTSVPSSTELANLMSDAYWGTDYLANVAARYGYGEVRDKIIRSRADTLPSVRRGDFGEAVTVEYLKTVEDYHIPVMKLRYKVGANQTLPGTDCIAFRFSDGRLVKVAFVESKFRTSKDPAVAVEGTKQLQQDADSANSETLVFVARQLREKGDPLAELIEDYIFGRDTELDEFLLMILYERGIWDERILEDLEDESLALEPLHVYVTRITGLRQLTDAAFAALDVEVVEDDQ